MINLKLFINKIKQFYTNKLSIHFSHVTFCFILQILINTPLLSHAQVTFCRNLFTQSELNNSTSTIHTPSSHKFDSINKNFKLTLLTKLLNPEGDLFKNKDNSIKDAFNVEFDHHNHKFHLISLKIPDHYQLINALKDLGLITSLNHIGVKSQNPNFLEQVLNESINNGKVVQIENNQHRRLIFSPTLLQWNYINKQNAIAKENLIYEIGDILEQSLSLHPKDQVTKSSEYYLAITLLIAALSPHSKDQSISNNIISKIFPKDNLIKLIQNSIYGPELLNKNNLSTDNLERLSYNQLIELLQHINNYELEPNSKLRKTNFSISNLTKESEDSYFEKIKIGNLNINNFILEKNYDDFKFQPNFKTNIKFKTQDQLNKIRDLIKKADLEILILHEVHSESIKKFIKDNFNDLYEVHTLKKSNGSLNQLFSTAILVKTSLPINVKVVTHEKINNRTLTHPIFEYHFISKNEPPSSAVSKAIIIAGHLKSLLNNGEQTNKIELNLLRSLIESTNEKYSETPILTAFDLNNDLANKDVRNNAFGNQFEDVRLKNKDNISATHFTIDPKQLNTNPIKPSEIDALFGNKKAQEFKLNETLSDDIAFLGFLDKNGQLKVPRSIKERESSDFISDHMIIFTFLSPQFLGLTPQP